MGASRSERRMADRYRCAGRSIARLSGAGLELVECAADVLEDLRVEVGGEGVTDNVAVARRPHHVSVSKHAEVLVCRRTLAAAHPSAIAGRQLLVAERLAHL